MKRNSLIIFLLLISICFTACENKNEFQAGDGNIFNGAPGNYFFDGNNYIILRSPLKTMILNKGDENISNLIRSPFYDPKDGINPVKAICNTNNGLYFLESETEGNYCIKRLNMKDYSVKIMAEQQKFKKSREVFLGLMEINQTSNLYEILKGNDIYTFFISGENAYILKSGGLYVISMKNSKPEKLIINDKLYGQNISCDGKYIYYINDKNELYRYTISNGSKIKLSKSRATYFVVTPNYIVYSNLSQKGVMYRMKKDGTDNIKVGDAAVGTINFDDNYIYYTDKSGGNYLYKMDYNGSNKTKLLDKPVYFIYTFKNYDKIFIMSDDEGTNSEKNVAFYSIDLNGKNMSKLGYMD